MIQHRDIFNTVRDAIFIADIHTGMIVDANRAAEALCGRSLDELRSIHHTQLHPPEFAERARRGFEQNALVPGLAEGLILRKDGRRVPVEIASSHFTDADGRVMLVGVFRDTTERDEAREALRQSEERFRQVAESAGEFIWEVDAAGLYVYASPVVSQILGYTSEEIVGRQYFYDFFVPETREAIKKAAFEAFDRKEPFRAFLNWNVRRDGTLVALETSGRPILDSNGNLLGYRGADTDVTERKRTEAALRESEDLYRTLFDQAADCVFLLDLSAGMPMVVGANAAAAKSHGYSGEEMIGQPLSLIEPEVSQESLDARMRLIAEGKPFYMLHRRKDGSTFEVESAARLVRIGAQEVLLAVGRDITERKQVERELKRQNEFIRAVLDNVYDGVVACDAEGNLALFNRAAREWHGIDARKMLPDQWSTYYDLFGPDGETPLATESIPLKRAFNGEHIRDLGLTIAAKGQPLRHVLASGCPFYDHDGNKLGAVTAMHDITEQKRSEQALHESEERFRVTFEQAAVGIAHVSPDGRFLRVNRRFCQIVGYSPQQMLERTFQEITHPDDLEADVQEMRCLLRGEIETYSMEKRYVRCDGGLVWVDLTVALVRDQAGDPGWFVSVVQDITERKRVEDALRTSEERFRALADSALVGIYILQDGKYTYVNPAMAAVFGYSVAEMTGMVPHDIVHPSHHDMVDENIRRRIGGHVHSMRYEVRGRYRDGSVRDVEVYGSTVELNGQPALVGTLIDISDRKRAERALRESTQQILTIANCLPDVLWTMDLSGRFTYVSPRVEQMTGWTPEEFLKLTFLDTMTLAQRMKSEQSLRDELIKASSSDYNRNSVNTFESEELRKDGTTFWAEVSAALLWVDGSPAGVIGITRDITERKRQEREREHLQHELAHAQKMELVGRLAGGIAHDFNNLMSVVLMYADSALEELRSGESATDTVEAIRGAAERAITLGRQLMAFSSKQILQPEVLDLNSAVADCQKLLRRLIGEDVKVVFRPSPGLGHVKGDRVQITQILVNLAVNARDAMPEGGTFTIETAAVEFVESDPRTHPDAKPGSYVVVTVRDTGVGMDGETLARIFEPFFTTKPMGKGTGLGLSVVYGIVKQSNGFIRVESEPGLGSEFKIYLPVAVGMSKRVLATEEGPIEGGSETILLVEDEPALRKKIHELLQNAGYRVLTAENGYQGFLLASSDGTPIHLLLTDVVMPELSGIRLAERLQPLRPNMKVLYMSGYPAAETASLSQSNFIQKPFTKPSLLRRIRDVLG